MRNDAYLPTLPPPLRHFSETQMSQYQNTETQKRKTKPKSTKNSKKKSTHQHTTPITQPFFPIHPILCHHHLCFVSSSLLLGSSLSLLFLHQYLYFDTRKTKNHKKMLNLRIRIFLSKKIHNQQKHEK